MTDHVELSGKVIAVNRDKFSVQIEKTDKIVTAQLSGKMRTNKIRVLLGDRVGIKLSPYDLTHGILVSRS